MGGGCDELECKVCEHEVEEDARLPHEPFLVFVRMCMGHLDDELHHEHSAHARERQQESCEPREEAERRGGGRSGGSRNGGNSSGKSRDVAE